MPGIFLALFFLLAPHPAKACGENLTTISFQFVPFKDGTKDREAVRVKWGGSRVTTLIDSKGFGRFVSTRSPSEVMAFLDFLQAEGFLLDRAERLPEGTWIRQLTLLKELSTSRQGDLLGIALPEVRITIDLEGVGQWGVLQFRVRGGPWRVDRIREVEKVDLPEVDETPIYPAHRELLAIADRYEAKRDRKTADREEEGVSGAEVEELLGERGWDASLPRIKVGGQLFHVDRQRVFTHPFRIELVTARSRKIQTIETLRQLLDVKGEEDTILVQLHLLKVAFDAVGKTSSELDQALSLFSEIRRRRDQKDSGWVRQLKKDWGYDGVDKFSVMIPLHDLGIPCKGVPEYYPVVVQFSHLHQNLEPGAR